MSRMTRLTIAGAGAIGAIALILAWGPLDPPQGPIQPTMHTLDEIYEQVAGQNGEWHSLVVKQFEGSKEVIEGGGIVHAVIFAGLHDGGAAELRQSDGTPIVVLSLINELGTVVVPLDVRYTDGLTLADVDGGGRPLNAVTILYRPDGE
jgi:hypothetical protein